MSAMLDPLFDGMQEEFNRVAGTDNWRMHDTPKLSPEYFDKMLGIALPYFSRQRRLRMLSATRQG
jgi:hypothetical protein